MSMFSKNDRLYKLENAINVRDLGGYVSKNGKITAFTKFIRGAGIHNLSKSDIEVLKKHNLKTIIDLRSEHEILVNPDPKIDGVMHYNVAIGDVDLNQAHEHNLDLGYISTFYLLVAMQSSKYIKEIFDIFLERSHLGGILFHCTAGKDRTGIIASLLMLINNIDEESILEDYSESYTNLLPDMNRIKKESIQGVEEHFFYSEKRYMKKFIDYILEKYENIDNYFSELGYNKEEIKKISNLMF